MSYILPRPRPYYSIYWILVKYERLKTKNSHQDQTYGKRGSFNFSAGFGVNRITEKREEEGKKTPPNHPLPPPKPQQMSTDISSGSKSEKNFGWLFTNTQESKLIGMFSKQTSQGTNKQQIANMLKEN